MEEYLTQWVHEIKLPLATLQMITERLDDYELASNLKNEVVKMNILVNRMEELDNTYVKVKKILNKRTKTILNITFKSPDVESIIRGVFESPTERSTDAPKL